MSKIDVYQKVTDRIIEALESGTVPWHRPWRTLGGSRNIVSKRPYSGINTFLLAMTPYGSPWWGTFKNIKALGGNVRKGEKATMVVFWKILEVDDKESETGKRKIPILRYYNVFNAEQCEGLDEVVAKLDAKNDDVDHDPIDDAQALIDGMPNAPVVHVNGSDSAYYRPSTDEVHLPRLQQFESAEAYYTVAFHELAHSTGHEKRLHRSEWDESFFGSESYSKEELVAEMAAAMLAGTVGIEGTFENSAAYIATWLKRLNDDPKFVVNAAARAQKAANYIIGEEVSS